MLPTVNELASEQFPHFRDERGVLVPLDVTQAVPFPVVRIFWIFDVPAGSAPGGHAHKACNEYLICASGLIEVEAYDGRVSRTIILSSGSGVHVPPTIFTTERFNLPRSILIVLCDRPYEAEDYLTSHQAVSDFPRNVIDQDATQ
jgi:hypothetical protein